MRSRRSAILASLAAVVVALVIAASVVWLPYYSVGPGPARDVAPLIRVGGTPVYQSQGHFLMTSVSILPLTALGMLVAWLDPQRAVVGRSALFTPGETDQQEQQRAISEMDQSKLDATYLVLKRLKDYPADHGTGALVESVVPGCAADGELYPGDLITAIDGARIATVRAASRAIATAPSGSTLSFDISVDGEPEHVQLVRRPCGGSNRPLVGVSLIPEFPFRVAISSGDVGGPSAGLMWALTLYDLLTPGDLTGGRTIAGTGVVTLGGKVEPIGGIQEKIAAAKDVGAEVLILPKGNVAEARSAGADGIRLVPVASFDDALAWLESHR